MRNFDRVNFLDEARSRVAVSEGCACGAPSSCTKAVSATSPRVTQGQTLDAAVRGKVGVSAAF